VKVALEARSISKVYGSGRTEVEALRDVSVGSRTLKRDQVPEDVVGAVAFLCGPGATFITGQTMVIDGGQYFH